MQIAIPYTPHERQREWHTAPHRVKALVAGARSGKTKAGANELVVRALLQPGYLDADRIEGKPYLVAVGAPTYPMLRDVVIPEVMRTVPPELVVDWHKSDRRLVLRARGAGRFTHILFKHCQTAESWEGLQLYYAWLDEAAQIHRSVYNEVRTRLADRRGTLALTGTPKGKNWVYHDIYLPSLQDGARKFCLVYPTSDNPHFPREELESERASLPAKYFRRTYQASFEEFVGQVYEEWDPSRHLLAKLPDEVSFSRVVAGVDFGYTNRGVLLVAGITSSGDWYVIDEESASNVLVNTKDGTDSWIRRAKKLQDRWRVLDWYCDPSEPGHIEAFRRAGLNARPALNAVTEGIQAVATLLHPDERRDGRPRLRILRHRCPKLVEYLPAYHWEENKDGDPKESPAKVDDHEADALRYAVLSEIKRGGAARFVDHTYLPY